MQSDASSFLFSEKSVGKLLARFALPAVFAQVANSIYLVVDQILLARSDVGTMGYGATSVAFPILTAANALTFLFGGGGAAFASLRRGEGDAAAGQRALRYSLLALLGSGLILVILGFCFLEPILLFFGATAELLPYATAYSRILLLGIPVIALGGALSYWVRADGSPGFSMTLMLTGAVLNVVFDWLFLFPLGWGIAGLAWAMVLSRLIAAAVGVWYLLRRAKHFALFLPLRFPFRLRLPCSRRRCQNPAGVASADDGEVLANGGVASAAAGEVLVNGGAASGEGVSAHPVAGRKILRAVVALGSSGFLMQCAILIVQIVTNRSLNAAATEASVDPSVAIGAMGVVTKVNGILIAIVTGLAAGAQPILGFHQGAGHRNEVRKTYRLTVFWATVAAFACWGVTVFGSSWVAGIFSGNTVAATASAATSTSASGASVIASLSALANTPANGATWISAHAPANGVVATPAIVATATDFASTAAWFMRVYLLAIFTAGFQLISSYYFQATGRPWKACLLTLSRQLFLLVPLILILPPFFGLSGILYAGPIADIGAALIAGAFMWKEMREP